jgi:heme-degrading monooxygenase HmoA
MIARVTLAEVDTVRLSMASAVEVFRASVLPALHEQDGYEGCQVLTTPEGKAAVVTFWESEEAAQAGVESGYYAEQVAKFVTIFRAPPGS